MFDDLITRRWQSELMFQLDEEPLDDEEPEPWPQHVNSPSCRCFECFTLGPLPSQGR